MRAAGFLLFLLYGTLLGTWTARIPAVKQHLGLTDGQLSLALLGFAGGAVVGMQVAGWLVDRFGSRSVTVPAAAADAVVLVLPALAPNLVTLAAALFLFGVVHGTLNVAMNAQAVAVQRARGHGGISMFHAVYSVGGFLGAAIGGVFASAHQGPVTTFVCVAVGGLVLTGVVRALSTEEPEPEPTDVEERSSGRVGVQGLLFLGVLVFCCLVGEGAAADWSSVYLKEDLHSDAGFAASAYAAFSLMMMAGRLVGDRLTATVGPVRLVFGSGVLAAVGLGAGLLADNRVGAVVGFGLFGAGLSCIAPQVFAAAGNRDPARAGSAIARVAGLGFLGFVVGPVVIGQASRAVPLGVALAIPAVLALFVALSARAVRSPQSIVVGRERPTSGSMGGTLS
jgi:predicted MFS family arabinose efflux permease